MPREEMPALFAIRRAGATTALTENDRLERRESALKVVPREALLEPCR